MVDPIAAFKRQQQWAGFNKDDNLDNKTEDELRKIHPRWAKIFNQIDEDSSGTLELQEVREGFGKVAGAGVKIPRTQVDELFKTFDVDGTGSLNFCAFCKLSKAVNAYMKNNPNWGEIEEKAQKAEREEKEAEEKARKDKEVPDVFDVLGIKKSKDQVNFEANKAKIMENKHAQNFIKTMQGGRRNSVGAGPTQFATGSKFANKWGAAMGVRRGSAPAATSSKEQDPDSPLKKLRESWEPKTIAPSTAPKTKKLAVHKVMPLQRTKESTEKKRTSSVFLTPLLFGCNQAGRGVL